MEQPKSKKNGKYWVLYQPKDDPFTHIRYFDNYDDAVELFNSIRVLHREFEIPVRIELAEFPSYTKLLQVNTIIE